MFLFVGRFVLEFNHSAPQGAFSSQPRPHSTADQRSKIERKSICAHNTYMRQSFLLTYDDYFIYIGRLFYLHTTTYPNICLNCAAIVRYGLTLRKYIPHIRVTTYTL